MLIHLILREHKGRFDSTSTLKSVVYMNTAEKKKKKISLLAHASTKSTIESQMQNNAE